MRRLADLSVEYGLLVLILVGVPLACAWLGGYEDVLDDVFTIVPQTDDWQSRPERLWKCRCPFSWLAFVMVGGAATALVAPFVWRGIRRLLVHDGRDAVVSQDESAHIGFPWWGWAGVAVMVGGWILAWNRFAWVAPVQRFTYIPLWMGLIVALNGLVYKRSGRCPLAQDTGRYLTLFPVSAAFWWFFEYLNRYVWNWFWACPKHFSPGVFRGVP